MSKRTVCDGCGKELKPGSMDHGITGQRANGAGGGGMPDGEFDLCVPCTQRAFAVLAKRGGASFS